MTDISLRAQSPKPLSPPSSHTAAIAVRDLVFSAGDKQILKGVSLSVGPGEILCIMGMSGSGKTTLLHCIGGLNQATSGEIWIGDQQIVGMNERDLNTTREKMGMVFQYAALFDSLSVMENVAFGLRRRRRLPEEEVRRIVAEKLSLSTVPGTERLFPSQLSGGMAKRVGLARALALEPGLLLYDEPTSGLDPVAATVIDNLVVSLRDKLNVTSVIVSHNMVSVFRIADKIAMIHEGKLEAFGTPDDIKAATNPIVQQFIAGKAEGPIDLARR